MQELAKTSITILVTCGGFFVIIKLITDLIAFIQALVLLVMSREVPGTPGSSKRAAVITDAVTMLNDSPAGPFLKMLPQNTLEWLIGVLVDFIVKEMNTLPLFKGSSATSSSGS